MVGIRITVRNDFAKTAAKLKAMAKKQVPFAISLTLNQLAREVQAEVKNQIPKNFNLRRKWIVNGIRVKSSTKKSLEAAVFSRDKIMNKHEFGGSKTSSTTKVWKVGNKVAIPTALAKGGRAHGIVPEKFWPENLKDAFRIQTKDGRDFLAIRMSGKLAIMYTLEDKITVKDRLKMRVIGNDVVKRRLNKVFGEKLAYAIATEKLK